MESKQTVWMKQRAKQLTESNSSLREQWVSDFQKGEPLLRPLDGPGHWPGYVSSKDAAPGSRASDLPKDLPDTLRQFVDQMERDNETLRWLWLYDFQRGELRPRPLDDHEKMVLTKREVAYA